MCSCSLPSLLLRACLPLGRVRNAEGLSYRQPGEWRSPWAWTAAPTGRAPCGGCTRQLAASEGPVAWAGARGRRHPAVPGPPVGTHGARDPERHRAAAREDGPAAGRRQSGGWGAARGPHGRYARGDPAAPADRRPRPGLGPLARRAVSLAHRLPWRGPSLGLRDAARWT